MQFHGLRLDETPQGGIILPDSARENPLQGEVLATGPGALNDNGIRTALDVKKGDRIIFGKYAGNEIKLDGEEYQLLRETDILAVYE